MEPTPFARRLQGPIKTALASVSLALALPQKFDPARARATVRLGASDYFGPADAAGALPSCSPATRPASPWRCCQGRPTARSRALVAGEVDLAAGRRPARGARPLQRPARGRAIRVRDAPRPPARARPAHARAPARLSRTWSSRRTAQSAAIVDRALVAARPSAPDPGERARVRDRLRAPRGKRPRRHPPGAHLARAGGRFGLVLRKPPIDLPGYTLSIAWHQRTAHDAAHRWVREQLLAIAGRPPVIDGINNRIPQYRLDGRPRRRLEWRRRT